jgi:hypothetical protein
MRRIAILVLCLALILPSAAFAIVKNNARDYIPAPPGTFAILTYYEHVAAQDFFRHGTKIDRDLGLTQNVGLLRPIVWFETPKIGPIGPILMDANFILPFESVSSNGTNAAGAAVNRNAAGFGDLLWIDTFWFVRNNEKKFYLAFTTIFSFPTGNFSRTRAINLGGNRFFFNEQLALVKGWEVIPGHNLYLEGIIQGQFYTNATAQANPGGIVSNSNFGTVTQSPELAPEAHISYDLTKTMFVAFDYYGQFLSRQSFNGHDLHNPVSTNTIGGTFAYSFAPGYQLMLQYTGDVAVQNGPQNNIFLARFLWATDFKSLRGAVGAP